MLQGAETLCFQGSLLYLISLIFLVIENSIFGNLYHGAVFITGFMLCL